MYMIWYVSYLPKKHVFSGNDEINEICQLKGSFPRKEYKIILVTQFYLNLVYNLHLALNYLKECNVQLNLCEK